MIQLGVQPMCPFTGYLGASLIRQLFCVRLPRGGAGLRGFEGGVQGSIVRTMLGTGGKLF